MQTGLVPECLMWSVNPCTVFLKGVPEKMCYIPTALPLSPSLHPYHSTPPLPSNYNFKKLVNEMPYVFVISFPKVGCILFILWVGK